MIQALMTAATIGGLYLPTARVDSNGMTYFMAGGNPPTNGSPVYALTKDGTLVIGAWIGRVLF
jgi:hypothetical protein